MRAAFALKILRPIHNCPRCRTGAIVSQYPGEEATCLSCGFEPKKVQYIPQRIHGNRNRPPREVKR